VAFGPERYVRKHRITSTRRRWAKQEQWSALSPGDGGTTTTTTTTTTNEKSRVT
jgi:hypothetical protein